MLSKCNVRTKLFAVVAPAVVGMCVLAVLGVQARLGDQRRADTRSDVITATRLASNLLHQLQRERVLAVTHAAAGDVVPAELVRQQSDRTDGAATAALTALGALDFSSVDGDAAVDAPTQREQLVGLVSSIGETRRNAGEGNGVALVSSYDSLASGLVQLIGSLELSVAGDPEAVGRHWLAAGIEAESSAAASAALSFGGSSELSGQVAERMARAATFLDEFTQFSGQGGREGLRRAQASMAYEISAPLFDQLTTAAGAEAFGAADASTWPNIVAGRVGALEQVESQQYSSQLDRLAVSADAASQQARLFAIAAAATVLLAALIAFAVIRGIIGTLRRLTDAANEITEVRMPALVSALRTGRIDSSHLTFDEIDLGSNDEFGRVGDAVNALGHATAEVAAEQHKSLQKGIGDIFVNLARRNQALLDRQIRFIDALEANERDEDQLEQLFTLDHLATRMRRNAESLLVLAGCEVRQRRSREVPMSDVIRSAVSEVEEFRRVRPTSVDMAVVRDGAADDLAHVLAELMENATQYSPPDRPVNALGRIEPDGTYVITISDQGVGMDDSRIAEANALLASPPPVGLALSRSLGLVVAATLAARHGIAIRLARSSAGGVTAEVSVPARLIDPTRSTGDASAASAVSASELDAMEAGTADTAEEVDDWRSDEPFFDRDALFAGFDEAAPKHSAASIDATDLLESQDSTFEALVNSSARTGWTVDGDYVSGDAAWEAFMHRPARPTAASTPPGPPPAPVPHRSSADVSTSGPPPFDPAEFAGSFLDGAVVDDAVVNDAPATLSEAIPSGARFERGLASLLGTSQPDDVSSGETTERRGGMFDFAAPLPQRRPGATVSDVAEAADARIASPTRAPEEVRSVLSRYRSGRSDGRAAAQSSELGDSHADRP